MPGLGITQLADLQSPTPDEEVKQREGPHGIQLSYVDARFVQERLDSVATPANWQSRFENTDDDGVRCGIGILVDRGESSEWVWKWDVGTPSDIEGVKGMHSDAFKRAGVQWGIARDLYDEQSDARVAAASRQTRQPIRSTSRVINNDHAEDNEDPSWFDDEQSPWVCPVHGQVKIVPAGINKRTHKPYNAFYACPDKLPNGDYCNEKPPRGMNP